MAVPSSEALVPVGVDDSDLVAGGEVDCEDDAEGGLARAAF